jgi:iron(III) transport system ATP-binding protein
MAVSVTFQSVTKRFGDTAAVDGVTFEIHEGELFFLLGPSGCGKSTALRTVAGFYQADEGDIHFGERAMRNVPPHERNTGMVFQNYALWPHMTVYQNVEYGLNVRKVPDAEKKRRVGEALDIVQMHEYAERSSNQLSGGQQQRVALARALVIEPDVLLLDEPLSNLDAKLRDEMRQEIKRIHGEVGLTTIYVTHDQREALSLASRVAVMRLGKIVQIGAPREIYAEPDNTFVAHFIGDTNFLDGRIETNGGGALSVKTSVGQVRCDTRQEFSGGDEAVLSIRPESLRIGHAAEAEADTNSYEATVVGATYLGTIEEYELALSDDVSMRASVYNPGHVEHHPGDRVHVSFDASDVVPLRRPDESA